MVQGTGRGLAAAMRAPGRIAAMLAGAALAVSPAAAQQKNFDLSGVPEEIEDQLFCLYDPLVEGDDYFEIEDVVFATDLGAEESQTRIQKALAPYSAVCERVHVWSDEQSDLAREATLYLVVADLLYERIRDEDVPPYVVDRIDEQIEIMPNEELAPFASGKWRTDASVRKTMEDRLKGLGVPEEDKVMSLALEYATWTISFGYTAVGFINTFVRN